MLSSPLAARACTHERKVPVQLSLYLRCMHCAYSALAQLISGTTKSHLNIWKLTVISGKVNGRDLIVRQIIVIKWFMGFSGKNANICRANK